MKHFTFLLAVFFQSLLNTNAQSTILANDNDELYRCAVNKLLLDISGYPYNELTLVPDTGTIQGSDGQYEYSVDELVNSVNFKVYHKGTVIAQKSYDLYYYPYPVGYICNRCPYSWIYKSELLRCKEIKVIAGNGATTIEYRVIGFEMQGAWESPFLIKPGTSGSFTPEMLNIIQSLVRNEKFWITNLKYIDESGVVQEIPEFTYIVK
ncbi:MAG: hypothetical protein JXB49_29265 [Bacteroidales bacterium]|nr:hypothetical protein [Bacteroidales bacterium]